MRTAITVSLTATDRERMGREKLTRLGSDTGDESHLLQTFNSDREVSSDHIKALPSQTPGAHACHLICWKTEGKMTSCMTPFAKEPCPSLDTGS